MSKKIVLTEEQAQGLVIAEIQKERLRRAEVAVRHWHIHLLVYLVANVAFSVYGLLRHGLFWPILSIVFWGIGFLIHSVSTLAEKRGALSGLQAIEDSATRQEDYWWKSRWIRIVVMIIGAVVVFGIIQPVIWELSFDSSPPQGAVDISNLLTIVLALLALGVGAFGAGVYLVLKGRVEAIARKEAEKRSNEAQAKVTYRLVLQIVKIAIKEAYDKWKTIKVLQNQKGQKAEQKRLQKWSINSLRDALDFAEDTLPVAQNKEFWENVESKKHLMTLKNNLAFYMACRKESEDREDARRYAREIEKEAHSQTIPDYDYLDTAAWVFRQFALNDEDRNESEALVLELTNREDISDKEKRELLGKYQDKPKTS